MWTHEAYGAPSGRFRGRTFCFFNNLFLGAKTDLGHSFPLGERPVTYPLMVAITLFPSRSVEETKRIPFSLVKKRPI